MTNEISDTDYERALLEKLTLDFPPPLFRVEGTRNRKKHYITGMNSGGRRQIDAAVYRVGEDRPIFVADAKRRSRALDVTAVDGFVGLLDDIGCRSGLLVSPRNAGVPAVRYATKKNIQIYVMTIQEALEARWLDIARSLIPYDWAYHPQLARAIELIYQDAPPWGILECASEMPFDEWLGFVKYALVHHREEAVRYLFLQLKEHGDHDVRIATLSWMLNLDVITVDEARGYEFMFSVSPEHLGRFREVIRENDG